MSLFSKLFGGGSKEQSPQLETEDYKGYLITADPMKEGSAFRIRATIEKEIGGEQKQHTLIRADVINDPDEAKDASVNKAKQMIDQMGDHLFN